MNSIPKPDYCAQNWLDMTPTEKGRICSKCSKEIFDFSKMNWAEIEELQERSNKSLCGMYAPKQIEYWGRHVPSFKCSSLNTISRLLLYFSVSNSLSGQESLMEVRPNRLIIQGIIARRTLEGDVNAFNGAQIVLLSSSGNTSTNPNLENSDLNGIHNREVITGAISDFGGHYEIDLTPYIDTINNPILTYRFAGYKEVQLVIDKNIRKTIVNNTILVEEFKLVEVESRSYYVMRPTFWQKVKSKIRRVFIKITN